MLSGRARSEGNERSLSIWLHQAFVNLVLFIVTSVYFSAHLVSNSLNSIEAYKAGEWETSIMTHVFKITSLKGRKRRLREATLLLSHYV